MRRPDDVMDESGLASYLFVDRVPDSKALTDSLRAHLDRVRADTIDSTCNENVLTFYGLGGMGKTRLSQRMEHWLQGELGDETEWGPRPIEKAATVRWDLDHGDGNLDLVAMVLALRVSPRHDEDCGSPSQSSESSPDPPHDAVAQERDHDRCDGIPEVARQIARARPYQLHRHDSKRGQADRDLGH